MRPINVSGNGFNCGYYALALATSLEIQRGVLNPDHLPAFLKGIKPSDVQDWPGNTKLDQIGQQMREAMKDALLEDADYKKLRIHSFIQAVNTEENISDMEAFYRLPSRSINVYKSMLATYFNTFDPNSYACNASHSPVERDQSIYDQLLIILESDHLEGIESLLNRLSIRDVRRFQDATLKLSASWPDAQSLNLDGPQVSSVRSFVTNWLYQCAARLIIESTPESKNRLLVDLAQAFITFQPGHDIDHIAKHLYLTCLVKATWDDIYQEYVDFLRHQAIFLSWDELKVLARQWGIHINLFNPHQSIQVDVAPDNEGLVNITLYNGGAHWQVMPPPGYIPESDPIPTIVEPQIPFKDPEPPTLDEGGATLTVTASSKSVSGLFEDLDTFMHRKLNNLESRLASIEQEERLLDKPVVSPLQQQLTDAGKLISRQHELEALINKKSAIISDMTNLIETLSGAVVAEEATDILDLDISGALDQMKRSYAAKAESAKSSLGQSNASGLKANAEASIKRLKKTLSEYEKEKTAILKEIQQEENNLTTADQTLITLNETLVQKKNELSSAEQEELAAKNAYEAAVKALNDAKTQYDKDLPAARVSIKVQTTSGPANHGQIWVNGLATVGGWYRGLAVTVVDFSKSGETTTKIFKYYKNQQIANEAAAFINANAAVNGIIIIVGSDEPRDGRNSALFSAMSALGAQQFGSINWRYGYFFIKGTDLAGSGVASSTLERLFPCAKGTNGVSNTGECYSDTMKENVRTAWTPKKASLIKKREDNNSVYENKKIAVRNAKAEVDKVNESIKHAQDNKNDAQDRLVNYQADLAANAQKSAPYESLIQSTKLHLDQINNILNQPSGVPTIIDSIEPINIDKQALLQAQASLKQEKRDKNKLEQQRHSNHLALIKLNLSICNPSHVSELPIINAARRKDSEAVRFLIEHGINVNAKDSDGYTALHHLLANTSHHNVHEQLCLLESLLLAKADLVALDHLRQQPIDLVYDQVLKLKIMNAALNIALRHGLYQSAADLLELGAEPNTQADIPSTTSPEASPKTFDSSMRTPLMWAIMHGDHRCVQLVFNAGCSLITTDCKKNTALHYLAMQQNQSELISETISFFQQHEEWPVARSMKNGNNMTPADLATDQEKPHFTGV